MEIRRPVLALVVDRRAARQPLVSTLADIVRAGIDWVQIRDRELPGAKWLAWAEELAAAAAGATVIINRRADVALCLGLRTIHLGGDAMEPRAARALLGSNAWVGVSAHAPPEVAAAARAGASYAQLAPIFPPISKPAERPALGLEALAQACRHGIPILAQGGIDASNATRVLAAGAAGVAVTGTILMAESPVAATARLRQALDGT